MKITLILLTLTLSFSGIFAQKNKNLKCALWKPASFCEIPQKIKIHGFTCSETQLFITPCETLNEDKSNTGVIFKLPRKYGKKFQMVSGFKNIKLVRQKNGETVNPIALILAVRNPKTSIREYDYYSSKFTTKTFQFFWGIRRYLEFIMIFPGAEKGDKIIFDDIVEAEIE
ncbi:MAG: hypothetical protein A2275_00680 [Bacteroidetes bacterium RIFOXYA12_FULL_35_11]|nr:MAG: hypothetical protein A2X01_20910 [Bacteroidetes bacterium GWF2_35_48]OFY82074.1 MAG: hypothetical protein A2275_00680 [Bacteroidetes bacterium RIFOXYA12_FULL_35_11]OFY97531.1 MAG: hypothetical protein A2309_06580 [Bacteroidetes bacterium RIFOXYB2_FULL_35_7]OFZ04698.1 MAG: hypothetical protein A2491_13285 [Bacteroidetes bacterium RIFOXYC12_FULL_35_7]HBX51386.1 hypothetical protein [Bacteroidales bacterium]